MTKKEVSEVRNQIFDGLYQYLGIKKREKCIYRLDKGRERNAIDMNHVKSVKDEEDKVFCSGKRYKRIGERRISIFYLMKDTISHWTLPCFTLEKRSKIIIITIEFRNKR